MFPIEIPPLRERRDDTPALAKHFVSTFASHLSRPIPRIAVDAMEEMMAYDWPGNVRELEHVLQRAVILSVGSEIASEDLGIHSGKKGGQTESLGAFPTLEENERQYLLRALSHTNGVIHGPQGAASLVQVKPTTLRSRLERLGVSFKKNDPTRDIRDTK